MHKYILIGIDSVDSYFGGCTTHFSTYLIERILKVHNGCIIDYPRLIRLNPDIPWKTRGNGSVAIEALIPDNELDDFISWVKKFLHEYLVDEEFTPNTQPAIVILDGSRLNTSDYAYLYRFGIKALHRLITLNEVESVWRRIYNAIILWYTPYGARGLIGALSAIGNYLPNDHTYELLAYRNLSRRERNRGICEYCINNIIHESELDFAHYDLETNKTLITPHGPDPVILGIRGNNPSIVLRLFYRISRAYKHIIKEVCERWIVYVTNQGTSEHLRVCLNPPLEVYSQGFIKGVIRDLTILKGGHIKAMLELDEKQVIHTLVYRESGGMRRILLKLPQDTLAIIGGSTRMHDSELTLNAELVKFNPPIIRREELKPICPSCKSKMESLGYNRGYVCKKCRYHIYGKIDIILSRNIWLPSIILPPYRSIKHVSKPLKRYGREHRVRYKGLRSIKWFWIKDSQDR